MSTSPIIDAGATERSAARVVQGSAPLLICLPSMPAEASADALATVSATFSGVSVLVVSPDVPNEVPASATRPALIPYTVPREGGEWVLTPSDYLAAARVAEDRGASAVLLLGPDAFSLQGETLRTMHSALTAGADLALPRYRTAATDRLVNSALLYPLTRALFGADVRFPLPLDAGLSSRMLSRLAIAADRLGSDSDGELIWPVSEASLAGFTMRQVEGGNRSLPHPQQTDFNELFPSVTGSLFADVEAKAAFWQRTRAVTPRGPAGSGLTTATPNAETMESIRSLVENYRVAFNNLRDIWSLVLPPHSLLALKKLSLTNPETFSFAPGLWARIVYDFALAFHLRTLNRGHLLGALTPLYLGWAASFLRATEGDGQSAFDLLETTAVAYEQEKPYLVSRWRWPDRFNP